MLNGKLSVLRQKKVGEFPVSQITADVLKKYKINMSVSRFKNLIRCFPYRIIITGSPFDETKQRQTKLYDLIEIAEIVNTWSDE